MLKRRTFLALLGTVPLVGSVVASATPAVPTITSRWFAWYDSSSEQVLWRYDACNGVEPEGIELPHPRIIGPGRLSLEAQQKIYELHKPAIDRVRLAARLAENSQHFCSGTFEGVVGVVPPPLVSWDW